MLWKSKRFAFTFWCGQNENIKQEDLIEPTEQKFVKHIVWHKFSRLARHKSQSVDQTFVSYKELKFGNSDLQQTGFIILSRRVRKRFGDHKMYIVKY